MKREDTYKQTVINSSSKKMMSFVDGLRKQKLTQQEKLSNMKECTFVVSL